MQLVSIEVSDADMIRVLDAFGGTVDGFQAGVRAFVADKVREREIANLAERHNRERQQVAEKVDADVTVALGSTDPLARVDPDTGLAVS